MTTVLYKRLNLCGDGAKCQFFVFGVDGNSRDFATFDQIGDSFTDSLCIPKKLDAELVVFVPPYD